MSAPEPGPPVITAEAAATALCEYFLANAERDDNAANDDLVAELVDRIRARRQSGDDGPYRPSPRHSDGLTPAGGIVMAEQLTTIPITYPAGSRSTCPGSASAPGGQPDPTPHVGAASEEQLGTRCPGEEHSSLLTDVAGHGLARDLWCDVNGTPVALFSWVEQVRESPEPGALPSWLHQHGQVVGGGLDSLYVCFAGHHVISLRPDLVRVLDAAPGGD